MIIEDIKSKIASVIADADSALNVDGGVLSSQADAWFRQRGTLNDMVINNIIIELWCGVKGMRDLNINFDQNTNKLRFDLALNWFSYKFRRKHILRTLGQYLSVHFPTFDVELRLFKFKDGWNNIIQEEYENKRKEYITNQVQQFTKARKKSFKPARNSGRRSEQPLKD